MEKVTYPLTPDAVYEDSTGCSFFICRHPLVILEKCSTIRFWYQFYLREQKSTAQSFNDPQLHPLHDDFCNVFESALYHFEQSMRKV